MTDIHNDPQTIEQAKHVVDVLSVGTVVGAITGYLPAIAALFTIVWTGIRIYESDTVQRWLGKKQPPSDNG